MKNTPFTEKHQALGAKMAAFAGFNMPISYSGINDEHAAVRNNAGVFDVSHMGEFILKGENDSHARCLTAHAHDHVNSRKLRALGRRRQAGDRDLVGRKIVKLTIRLDEEMMMVRHVGIEIRPSRSDHDLAQQTGIPELVQRIVDGGQRNPM